MRPETFIICSLVLALAFGICAVAYNWKVPFRLARHIVLVAAGRNDKLCTLSNAIGSALAPARTNRLAEGLSRASRLLETTLDGLELWDTPRGRWWLPTANGAPPQVGILLAEWEMDIYRGRGGGIRPGDIVLDCGAYAGTVTRQALLAGAAKVVAIEPAPQALECLRRNLKDDISAGRVILSPKAVSDQNGTAAFELNPPAGLANRVVAHPVSASRTLRVPAVTIDSLVEELRLERVDFIKMDIEGAEPTALAGAQGTLRKWRPRLAIAAYHHPGDAQAILRIAKGTVPEYRMSCACCFTEGRWTGPLFPQVIILSQGSLATGH